MDLILFYLPDDLGGRDTTPFVPTPHRHYCCVKAQLFIFTARRSYASSVLGVVTLSVRLSHACFVTNPKNLPAIFLYRMKGQSFKFSATQQWLVGDIPFHLKWAIEVTHLPSKIARVDRFPPVSSQQQELA